MLKEHQQEPLSHRLHAEAETLHPLPQKQGQYLSWDTTTHLWGRYEAWQFIRLLSELMLNNWEFTASSSACAKTAAEMSLSQRYVFSQPLTLFSPTRQTRQRTRTFATVAMIRRRTAVGGMRGREEAKLQGLGHGSEVGSITWRIGEQDL